MERQFDITFTIFIVFFCLFGILTFCGFFGICYCIIRSYRQQQRNLQSAPFGPDGVVITNQIATNGRPIVVPSTTYTKGPTAPNYYDPQGAGAYGITSGLATQTQGPSRTLEDIPLTPPPQYVEPQLPGIPVEDKNIVDK